MAASTCNRWIHIPVLFKFHANFLLLLERLRMPVQIENFFRRAQEVFRSTMALKAPSHAEWFCFINDRHFINCAMTAVTADPTVYMDGMIEIGVVRKLVNADPWNWLAGFPALLDWCEARAVGLNFSLAVTIDASLCVWNIRMTSNLNKAVAVAAVHA